MTGKGRGRGKTQQPPQQQGGAPPSYAQMGGGHVGAPQPQAAKPPTGSAWGPPPGASSRATHRAPTAQPGAAVGQVTTQMQQMALGGRAPQACAPAPAAAPPSARAGPTGPPAGGNGNGNGGPAVGRGAMRGRRPIDQGQILRTRPDQLATKKGSTGEPIGLLANYFRIQTVPDWALHQYRVDIAPEEDRTGERKFLLRAHRDKLGGHLFDGTVLYTTNRITSPQNPVLTWTSSNRDNSANFTITIREVGEVQQGDYAYVQVYNLLLRTCISGLELQLVGRDYYDAKARVEVPAFRLELWPGYKTSIRQHESNILMCVEITHKVMRMETVLNILQDCYQRSPNNYQAEFTREVVGCIVLTKYNNKTYHIDDVNWDINPSHRFVYRNEEVSYAQYMETKYQIKIRDMKQPLLVSRAKARDVRAGMAEVINLIPEVCYCTGLTDAMRANFQLMKALAVHTRVSPDLRIKKLRSFNERLQLNQQTLDQLKKFDMKLDRDLVRIQGRIAPEEKILFGGRREGKPGPQVDWTRDVRSSAMLHSQEIDQWVIVVPGKFKRDAAAFADMLNRAAGGMRFNLAPPRYYELQRDSAPEYVQALSTILDQAQPKLIMCAVPNNRGDRYSAIKKKCCVDRAVPTQVILTKNLNDAKKSMSIATKVAVQINCKVGGAPWGVEIPLPGLMVVGFDVCHDTNNKNQSFGAMVASLDKPMSRYFSAVTPHTNGEELSNNLALNIVKAVKKYAAHNGGPPQRILIYRDGVGEGQIPFVHSTELEAIKAKLAQVCPETKMTFVIVTKRINTRVFTDRCQNPPPGTVIDDVVTDPEKYDFFLVSQSVREGTVSPTSFNVIHDGISLPPDRLQRLTYKMCHLYFNWSGTVRVPAPCQYAHKLAFLVGQSLHREPSSALEDLLYFL
ncbi:hypothetical protein ONE63_008324 [Megalurothrips usitatus]|uniref:Piwi-like protein Siwi n=1 Tax=Megalurothrips usitatus TaxID=439358 RepID=A0AAV7XPZ2_9NEOP|nr:hypothetical protein ONE63_008324 [Megalurothrips usitatus]